jgi:hypothetical protein
MLGGADAARRGHVVDIGDGAEMPLQGSRDGARHDFRARAGQLRRYENRGHVDARQRRHRQQDESDAPHSATPSVSKVVATGRDEGRGDIHAGPSANGASSRRACARAAPARGNPVEGQINHRRREQRQHLADQKSAHDAHAQGVAQLRAGTGAEHQGQRAEDRRHRRHQNRAKRSKQAL